jgi:hypothetical protein
VQVHQFHKSTPEIVALVLLIRLRASLGRAWTASSPQARGVLADWRRRRELFTSAAAR